MSIKPIETVYNGYRFRSRLEARWAVFFDALPIRYIYETEGFDLHGTWYLPDFWLTEWECWTEIKPDVPSEQEVRKCIDLAKGTGHTCLLIYGQPWSRTIPYGNNDNISPLEWLDYYYAWRSWDYRFLMLRGDELDPYELADDYVDIREFELFLDNPPVLLGKTIIPTVESLDKHVFAICRHCPAINFIGLAQWNNQWNVHSFGPMEKCCDTDSAPIVDDPRLIAAYTAARQARFEHGIR